MMHATDAVPLLHRAHRRARLALLVWSAAAVLTAAALTGAARLGWFPRGELWSLAPALLAAALLIAWLKHARRLTRVSYARELDARWATRSRLETAVELSAEDSALARAQRTEAAQQLAEREHVGLTPWLAALTFIVAALLLLGVEGTALTLRAIRTSPTPTAAKPPAPPEARASIEWKTPAREIKATAIEEVPLTALADSAKGFRAVSLEVYVNGEASVSRALDAEALGESARPGPHELSPSLFLDETGAKPYDIVSYHLTGELAGTPARTVTSPLQFIQIRPPQKDTGQKGTANADAAKMLSLLNSLKAAQLRLIDANFTLARLTGAKDDAAWQTENDRVALDQKTLAQKAAEARDFALSKKAPPLIGKNLGEARTLMLDAAKAIAAADNDSAVKPQGRALALITECEKLFGQALEITGPPPPALPMEDPFHDDQVFKLPPRGETPAGELEKLAARQRDLSQQLGSSPGQSPGSGSGGDAEKNLAHDAEQLAASGKLDPAAQALTHDAATAAAASARQLDAHDPAAAREPAGAALAALEKAVEAQDRAGREIAVAELERVRRSLNAASRDDAAGTRGATLLAARDDLRAAATQQQLTGSAEAARQLSAVAESLGAAKLPGSDSRPNSTARARESATAAARAQVALAPRGAALARAIRQLKRAPSSGGGSGISSGTAGDLESASQEAEWLTADASTIALARKVSAQMSALQSKTPASGAAVRESLDAATRLAAALETAQTVGARDEIVRRFNVDEIDPAYRSAVENYFERLSREGAKPAPAPP